MAMIPSFIVHPSNAAPPLVACGAEFALKSPRGERVVLAGDFFTMPDEDAMVENVIASDEMLVEIRVPLARIKASAHVELREKASYAWALVAASAVRMDDGWKVVMGAVAPIPWRAEATEAELGDQAMSAELANKAGEAAAQGADPLRYNRYKVDLVKTTVRRALLAAAGMEAKA